MTEHKVSIVMKLAFLGYNTFNLSIHIFFRFPVFSFLAFYITRSCRQSEQMALTYRVATASVTHHL